MKITLTVMLVAPFLVMSQKRNDEQSMFYLNRIPNQHVENPFSYESNLLNTLKGKGVHRVTKELRHKPNGKVYTTCYWFDDLGRIVSVDKSGKKSMDIAYEDTLITEIRYSGRKEERTTISYNGGRMTLYERFSGDRLQSRTIVQYNEEGKIDFSSVSGKHEYSMHYTYDEGGQRLSQRFMKNNKIVKVWNYTCDEKGQDEKVEVDVCRYKEEHNDGSYTDYVRKWEDGEVLLFTHHYASDSSWQKSECTNEKNELQWQNIKTETGHTYTAYSKGKVKMQQSVAFDADGKITSSMVVNGKSKYETRYRYNEDGTLSSEAFSNNGKPVRQVTYAYDL